MNSLVMHLISVDDVFHKWDRVIKFLYYSFFIWARILMPPADTE